MFCDSNKNQFFSSLEITDIGYRAVRTGVATVEIWFFENGCYVRCLEGLREHAVTE